MLLLKRNKLKVKFWRRIIKREKVNLFLNKQKNNKKSLQELKQIFNLKKRKRKFCSHPKIYPFNK
jgi:hypothetical protein